MAILRNFESALQPEERELVRRAQRRCRDCGAGTSECESCGKAFWLGLASICDNPPCRSARLRCECGRLIPQLHP